MMFHLRIALVPFVTAMLSGCAGSSAPVASNPSPIADEIVLEVENTTTRTLRIYALHAGGETPLGRVSALAHRTLSIPGVVRGTLRLVARSSVEMGSNRGYVTEPISVFRGQHLEWRLQASPGISDLPHLSTVRVLACVADRC